MGSPGTADSAADYAFRFDLPIEPVVFGGELDIHGWLLHRGGNPIRGIRAVVKRRFGKPQVTRARRKRERPDVAAAFPDHPQAETSGFLIELRLGFGRNEITFQVQDEEKTWHTFSSATVSALPMASLSWTGFTNVRRFLIFYLKQRFAARQMRNASDDAALSLVDLRRRPDASPLRTRRVDLFATSKSNLFIIEIGELVAAGFRELGCEATLRIDGVPAEQPPPGTIQIVVTPHEYYNLYLTQRVPRNIARRLTYEVYLLCTEQPETGWFQSNLQWGSYARGVADINALGVAAYRARGLPSEQLHLGYHPMLEHPTAVPHRERQIDITFLGSMTSRRDKFFAAHADFFAQHRCHLRLVPIGFAKTRETRSYLSKERRNELLMNSRILLNVHYSDQKYFEWHRMLVGMANRCCIITETCQGYGLLEPGRHFVMVETEYLIEACEYYLAHPEECEQIAAAGHAFISEHLRQSQTCRTFLGQIEASEAAEQDRRESGTRTPPPLPLEADAPPAPLPPQLMRRFARHTRSLLGTAFRRDVQTAWQKLREPDAAVAETADVSYGERNSAGEPSLATQHQRAETIRKRAAYKERLDQQTEARGRGNSVWTFHDNAACAQLPAPALSVLITLYNYERHIEECLESITEGARHLDQPPEIVIVNDASTDKSLDRARSFQDRSALPIRIVDKRFNTGLADARNTGLEIARAPYVMMMDADNLMFPRGLRQLFDAISSGEYVAAYSLLCRFRGTPKRRVGLLSYFDFDPQILAQLPYVDAMAMFHRETLLELGGYDSHLSQIGWFGWEDYDMWLRIAQRDLPVAFVPNTLCLYRHHDTSMINTTNLFEVELVRHFIQRYGDLLDRFEPRGTIFGVDRQKIVQFREDPRQPEPATPQGSAAR